jgi:hypothetical protein
LWSGREQQGEVSALRRKTAGDFDFQISASKLRGGRRVLVGIVLSAVALSGLSACAKKDSETATQWNSTIVTTPAPKGWINGKDGAFRVQIPSSYLDAYDAISGSKLPDAQVVLSLSSDKSLNGYVPVMVIDHAKANSDPDEVQKNLKQDPIYKDYKKFTVLNPTQVEGLNVLEMKWNYVYQEVEMTAFMTLVSGNNHAYALKQDVPDYALETYQPIIDSVLKTWTWNDPVKGTKPKPSPAPTKS